MKIRELELLSPAANKDVAIQAIKHGADAVYIGPPSHGARKSAANSLDEIAEVVDFAHIFHSKVYATVNTIIYNDEIKKVETLCRDLYDIGVDALIIQDMGILKMKIPPIALHASTQCDIRTVEKAQFLEKVGFSQLVLARELTLNEIKEIASSVTIPVETFIHGALCVSYSGRCHASFALNGRSANRGECAQICRYPYSLVDGNGNTLFKDKYLLSLKDLNRQHNLNDLIEAGVNSFKIEGRLKDSSYVKNITALYHQQLDGIISKSGGTLKRSSYGKVSFKFEPNAEKSFNRGFTSYFLNDRKPADIASLLTPKSQGEPIKKISVLNNGDGISFFDKEGNFTGTNVNKIENGKIIPARRIEIPRTGIFRTNDLKWEKILSGETAIRKIRLNINIDNEKIIGKDERGEVVEIPLDSNFERANKPTDYREVLSKLGNTNYYLGELLYNLSTDRFYPLSYITELRRTLVECLDKTNEISYQRSLRRPGDPTTKYPTSILDYRDNVSNRLAEEFYKEHGVQIIEPALETSGKVKEGDVVMTTRHCVLRELGLCKKDKKKVPAFEDPLFLKFDGGKFRLKFDCKNCEMQVILDKSKS